MPSDDVGYGPRRLEALLDTDPADRSVPVDHATLAEEAREAMDPDVRDFVDAGAGAGETIRENRAAFRRWRIVPHVGRDVTDRDLSIELFDLAYPGPLLLAPIGVQSLVHPEGELATARAAASLGVPMVLSTVASRSMEEVADAMDGAPRWFQLYWVDDEAVVESLVERAEGHGYEAIVVTADTPVPPWREVTLERGHVSPPGVTLANFFSDPVFADRLDADPWEDTERASAFLHALRERQNFTWTDLETLRGLTDLPILVKGVLRADDATDALAYGADGLVVSNHGGRQIDGSIGALDALPAVVDAVGPDVPILFDSGVRRGADAFKALALGAEAVLLGRPYLYGLALAGEAGAREVVENVLADLDLTLGMAGFDGVSALDRSALAERTPR